MNRMRYTKTPNRHGTWMLLAEGAEEQGRRREAEKSRLGLDLRCLAKHRAQNLS